MTRRTIPAAFTVLVAGLGVGVVLGACQSRVGNDEHCSNNEGDRYCAALDPSKPWCTSGSSEACSLGFPSGCVATQELEAECHDPCGVLSAEECAAEVESSSGTGSGSGESTAGSETEGSGTTTTGGMPCSTQEDCTDAAAPYCTADGVCVACDLAPSDEEGDAACALVDPTRGVCAEGTCVTCTAGDTAACDEQRLLCDVAASACVPCVAHEECSTGACELAAGTCFAEGMLVHVDGDGGQDFETVSDAVEAVPQQGYAVIIVHEQDEDLQYLGGLMISTGRKVALLSAAGENPRLQGSGMGPALRVQGEGTAVYLDGLDLVGNTNGRGVEVVGGLVWVDRSRIVQNTGGGVLASSGAELTLRNSFVGGDVNDRSAVEVDGATAHVLYTTVGAGFGTATALTCGGPATVNVRNSILVARTDGAELLCPGAVLIDSATEVDVGSFDIDWFAGYNGGDFSLTVLGTKTFAGIAQWQTGDPLTDINGDRRPNVDGSPDYAGADVP